MSLPSEAVARDPAWLPHTFNQKGDLLDFVRLEAEERRRLTFLAEEYVGRDFPHQVLSYQDVKALAPGADETPLHFIFHTSFCCSSLLARALEAGGTAESLREPDILMNLANRLLREPSSDNLARLDLALRLLSRPLKASKVIIKPSNFTNNLIGPILKLRPDARAVLLHSDLRAFLRSIAKKGMWGRIWVRKLFAQHSAWSGLRVGFSPSEMFELSDLQVAGLAWLLQARHFRLLALHHGAPRLTLLHSDTLLSQPHRAIQIVSDRFGLGHDAEGARRIADGEIFATNSKSSDQRFDAETRKSEHRRADSAHREEIDMVAQWAVAVADRIGIEADLADLDIRMATAL